MSCISSFQSIRPPYESAQEKIFEWLIEAHFAAEKTKGLPENKWLDFKKDLHEKLWRVGCKPDRIEKRGHIIADYLHHDWEKMFCSGAMFFVNKLILCDDDARDNS